MPAAKLILSWQNHVDRIATILSASSEMGDGSVSNLASPIVGRRWRTSTNTLVQFDFGENVEIGVVAFRFPRDTPLPTSGAVSHFLDADGGTPGAGAVYASGLTQIGTVEGYGYHVHVLPSAQTARYWSAAILAFGVSFVDIGRAWAGEAWRPTFNLAMGYEDEWADLSRISGSSRSGAEFVDERARQRYFAFGLNALDDDERDDIRELQRIAGISQQVLLVKDPDNPSTETILGRLARSTPIRHAEIPIHTKAFELRESL